MQKREQYFINSQSAAFCISIATTKHLRIVNITLFNLDSSWSKTERRVNLLKSLEEKQSETNHAKTINAFGKDYKITIQHEGYTRRLYGHIEHFSNSTPLLFDITLSRFSCKNSDAGKQTIKAEEFSSLHNISSCLVAEGRIEFCETEYLFAPANSFALFENSCTRSSNGRVELWGAASGLVHGKCIGLYFEKVPFAQSYQYSMRVIGLGDIYTIPISIGKSLPIHQFSRPCSGLFFDSKDNRVRIDFCPSVESCRREHGFSKRTKQILTYGTYAGTVQCENGLTFQINDLVGFTQKTRQAGMNGLT